MKWFYNTAAILVIIGMLLSCKSQKSSGINYHKDQFYGAWTEPNPINANEVQGFLLFPDGKAESINMHTLLYRQWWIEKKSLALVAESIGNKVTITDTIQYTIDSITNEKLVIRNGNKIYHYTRIR